MNISNRLTPHFAAIDQPCPGCVRLRDVVLRLECEGFDAEDDLFQAARRESLLRDRIEALEAVAGGDFEELKRLRRSRRLWRCVAVAVFFAWLLWG